MKSYKFHIRPTKKQEKLLHDTLFCCFKLYNTALQHRKDAYRSIVKSSLSYKEQANELPLLKEQFPEYKDIHSQVLQNVLKRVDLAYQGFFRRVKMQGAKAGFPRFRLLNRYDSFCYPKTGFAICGNNRVELSKIGTIRVKFHRQIPSDAIIKTCTVKREGDKWYVVFSCQTGAINIKKKTVSEAIGIDLGLTKFLVTSDGRQIANPKYLRNSESRLKEIQSRYSKGKSKRVKRQLVKLHHKVANQRKDFQQKLANDLVRNYDLIAYEDLKIKDMIENNTHDLQKHISDAA